MFLPHSNCQRRKHFVETAVQIEFQRCEDVGRLRQHIQDNVMELERRFSRITACRVFVRGPSEHHAKGGAFEVRIHLELPGDKQIDINRTLDEDSRHADAHFAIEDAFKRARRSLKDIVRRMQGHEKLHEPTPTATVRLVRRKEGYGFLDTTDGRDIYFHRNSVLNEGFDQLSPGALVHFTEEAGDEGPQASTVRPAGKAGRG